jgi:glycosyltransferase involved in cell wall biosynthesis
MRGSKRIGVVIPALNEERAIGLVVRDIPTWVDHVVVADNASTDRTTEVARAAGATVVDEPERGYGIACQTAIKALGPVDVVVFLDGDYSDFPGEMDKLVDPIIAGDADLVIGSRVLGNVQPGALTPQQRFGNWLATTLIRLIWGVKYTDLGPFRAISSPALAAIDMRDRNYGWTVEMQIKAARHGLRSLEVPVDYRPRIGVSKVSGTIRGSVMAGTIILTTIARSSFERAPVRPTDTPAR